MTKHLAALAELRKEFLAFRNECAWCKNVYNIHCALFGGDDDVDQTLRRIAGWFFYDLSAITQEYHVLVVGRLTDPVGTPGRSNLSAPLLVAGLSHVGRLTPEIQDLAAELEGYRKKIKPSRDKLVAHRDRSTIVTKSRGGDHAPEDVVRFHRDLNRFCDLVAIALGESPLDFSAQPAKGDVLDLLDFLQTARISDDS